MHELIESMKVSNCLACNRPPPVDIHHIRTRGAGGKDVPWNCIPLCRNCHQTWHKVGPSKFFELHTKVKIYLESIGWQTFPKLFHELNKSCL